MDAQAQASQPAHHRLKVGFVAVLWFVLGLALGGNIDISPDPGAGNPALAPLVQVQREVRNPALYPFNIFDARPPATRVPSLQHLASGAKSEEEILARVVNYYRHNKAMLEDGWQESDPERLQSLLAMYVIHISHPYGAVKSPPVSLLEYVRDTGVSRCDLYARFQGQILETFGLKWRYVAISSGLHGWVEVHLHDQWEIFDSNLNVWVDQSAFDLLTGGKRKYRMFYTPWSDVDRPEARVVVEGLAEPLYVTPGSLRSDMLGLGTS